MPPEKDLQDRRAAAREAMESPEHKAAREALAARRIARREEARRAMEDERRRAARLAAAEEEKRRQAAAEAAVASKKSEAAAIERAAAARVTAAKAEEAAQRARETTAGQTSNLIAELKSRQTVNLNPMRTLKLDMESAVEKKEVSLAGIVIAQKEKNRATAAAVAKRGEPRHQRHLGRWLLVFLLLLLAGGGIWIYFNQNIWQEWLGKLNIGFWGSEEEVASDLPMLLPPLISVDEQKVLPIDALSAVALRAAILATRAETPTPANSLLGLSLRQALNEANVTILNSNLNWGMPTSLDQALESRLQFGWHRRAVAGETPAGFLILRARRLENAWSNLRAWEKTLAENLLTLWGGEVEAVAGSVFSEQLKNNLELRVLRTPDDNRVLLVYGFVNQTIIVITETEDAFEEIRRRALQPIAKF